LVLVKIRESRVCHPALGADRVSPGGVGAQSVMLASCSNPTIRNAPDSNTDAVKPQDACGNAAETMQKNCKNVAKNLQ
jgi:hypothetical protein